MSTSSWQLRPTVRATPIEGGLHLRGWDSSLTLDDAPQLWRLWQLLVRQLTSGRITDDLRDLSSRPPVALALHRLAGLLREHDLLVRVPDHWATTSGGENPAGSAGPDTVPPAGVAAWLAATAADPGASWAAIHRDPVTVAGAGPIATAAVEALTDAGARVHPTSPDLRFRTAAGRVTLSVADGQSVVAGATVDVGFVTPAGSGVEPQMQAELIAGRLGLGITPPAPGDPVAAVAGASAAQRLLTALTDPVGRSAPADAPATPTVLVVRADPLRTTFHPWLPGARAPADAGRPAGTVEPDRLTALTDPELGVLPPAEADDLPQLPVGLARCRLDTVPGLAGGHDRMFVAGHGPDATTARLHATLATVELLLGSTADGTVLACGVSRRHAEAVLMRRLVHRLAGPATATRTGAVPPAALDAPAARRWWRTLTVRLGVPATVQVHRLAPGVHLARIDGDPTDSGPTEGAAAPARQLELGWAVEARPHDAIAFAALTAVARVCWRAHQAGLVGSHGPCGGFPRSGSLGLVAGQGLQDTNNREPVLQRSLRRLVGAPAEAVVVTPPEPLAAALHRIGLVVLRARDDR
ncbi:hypothetical protein [Micromonospora sp. LOL_024]|uniref:hypothetical protein n=1 Tax=Micromonospora sp. LOL_024 TaxID=3345412 RepID=UPI003A83A692